MNKREIGAQKEEEARKYLEQNGVCIKECNFRCRQGEIDLIGYDGAYLVFFEVKYRAGQGLGSAVEAVGITKQKKICKVSDYYRMLHECPGDTPIRFDVIAVDGDRIEWLQNAFPYYGY